jgi:hypothetical protein
MAQNKQKRENWISLSFSKHPFIFHHYQRKNKQTNKQQKQNTIGNKAHMYMLNKKLQRNLRQAQWLSRKIQQK